MPKGHNDNLMDVLFTLAHWHALAKLRQHTDLSLDILESVTVQLGELLRKFQRNTCTAYNTRELQREVAARARKTASKSSGKPEAISKNVPADTQSGNTSNEPEVVQLDVPAPSPSSLPEKKVSSHPKKEVNSRLHKALNLNTYKDHSLGDYVDSIRRNGTIDSYSTESVNIR